MENTITRKAPDALVNPVWKPFLDHVHGAISMVLTEVEYPKEQNVTEDEAVQDMTDLLYELDKILTNISYQ